LSSEEKYSILSLFEELRPRQSEVIVYKPIDITQLTCLAETMYFEARGESDEGMLAVGYVVLNRVSDDRFPKTICGVAKQGMHIRGRPVKYKCQFTWYCDGLPDTITDKDSYLKATELALQILTGKSNNPISNSLFYHAVYVRPRWSRIFAMVIRINKHLFYTYRNLVIASK
jgi:spore germination cell wall hydrolase CwlJ-like protein